MKWLSWINIVVLAGGIVAAPSAARAAEHAVEVGTEEVGDADQSAVSDWEFIVAPYIWMPGAKGSATIGDTTVGIDNTVGDTFDLLGSLEAGGAMAHIDVRKEELGFFVDFAFLAINTTSALGPGGLGSVRVKLLEYFVEYGASYRVLEYPTSLGSRSPIWVELLAGARWNRISTELAFSRLNNDLKSKIEFMDPLVGGRFVVPFYGSDSTGDFAVRFRGDIGGFGAGSDLAWNLGGGLQWNTPWTLAGADFTMVAGYKTYYFRVSEEDDDTNTALALQSGGPILGFAARF